MHEAQILSVWASDASHEPLPLRLPVHRSPPATPLVEGMLSGHIASVGQAQAACLQVSLVKLQCRNTFRLAWSHATPTVGITHDSSSMPKNELAASSMQLMQPCHMGASRARFDAEIAAGGCIPGVQEEGALHDVLHCGSLPLLCAFLQCDHVTHTHSSASAILRLETPCVLALQVSLPARAYLWQVWRSLHPPNFLNQLLWDPHSLEIGGLPAAPA